MELAKNRQTANLILGGRMQSTQPARINPVRPDPQSRGPEHSPIYVVMTLCLPTIVYIMSKRRDLMKFLKGTNKPLLLGSKEFQIWENIQNISSRYRGRNMSG